MAHKVAVAGNMTLVALASVTATTAAGVIGTITCDNCLIQAPSANSVNVLMGDATNQPMVLYPGAPPIQLNVYTLSEIYVKTGSGTAVVNVLALSAN